MKKLLVTGLLLLPLALLALVGNMNPVQPGGSGGGLALSPTPNPWPVYGDGSTLIVGQSDPYGNQIFFPLDPSLYFGTLFEGYTNADEFFVSGAGATLDGLYVTNNAGVLTNSQNPNYQIEVVPLFTGVSWAIIGQTNLAVYYTNDVAAGASPFGAWNPTTPGPACSVLPYVIYPPRRFGAYSGAVMYPDGVTPLLDGSANALYWPGGYLKSTPSGVAVQSQFLDASGTIYLTNGNSLVDGAGNLYYPSLHVTGTGAKLEEVLADTAGQLHYGDGALLTDTNGNLLLHDGTPAGSGGGGGSYAGQLTNDLDAQDYSITNLTSILGRRDYGGSAVTFSSGGDLQLTTTNQLHLAAHGTSLDINANGTIAFSGTPTGIAATGLDNSGSAPGQVLTATSGGVAWSNAPAGGGGEGGTNALVIQDGFGIASAGQNNIVLPSVPYTKSVRVWLDGTATTAWSLASNTVSIFNQPAGTFVYAQWIPSNTPPGVVTLATGTPFGQALRAYTMPVGAYGQPTHITFPTNVVAGDLAVVFATETSGGFTSISGWTVVTNSTTPCFGCIFTHVLSSADITAGSATLNRAVYTQDDIVMAAFFANTGTTAIKEINFAATNSVAYTGPTCTNLAVGDLAVFFGSSIGNGTPICSQGTSLTNGIGASSQCGVLNALNVASAGTVTPAFTYPVSNPNFQAAIVVSP